MMNRKHVWAAMLAVTILAVPLAIPAQAAPPERTRHIYIVDSEIRGAEGDLLHSDGAGPYPGQGGWGWIFDIINATPEDRDRYYFIPKGNRTITLSHPALGGSVQCDSKWGNYPYFSSIANPNWFDELNEEGSSTTGYMYVECTTGQHGARKIRAVTPTGTDVAGRSNECATATKVGAASYSFEVGTATFQSLPTEGLPAEVRQHLPSEIKTDGCPVYLYEDTRENHRQDYTTTYLGRFSAPLQITAHVTVSN